MGRRGVGAVLGILLLMALSGEGVLSQTSQGQAQSQETKETKETKETHALPSPAKETVKPGETPVQITADRLEYRKREKTYRADGNVVIVQDTMRIEGDHATLKQDSGEAVVWGNVHVQDGEDTVDAPRVELNLDTEQGVIHQGRLFIKKDNYHIAGETLEKLEVPRYRIRQGSLTTCDTEPPAWRIRARRFDIWEKEKIVGRSVRFHIRDVPVLYTPYIRLPLGKERKTGFLMPRIGDGQGDGFTFQQPFFWAIADNMDATFALDYRAQRGLGLEAEYRYILSQDTRGTLYAYNLSDKNTDSQRQEFRLHHVQQLPWGVSAKADGNYLSDRSLYRDIRTNTSQRVQSYIDSNVQFTRSWGGNTVYLLNQYSEDLTQKNPQTLQRLPELSWRITPTRIGSSPFFYGLNAKAINFWRKEGIKGQRVDVYPQFNASFNLARAVLITPRVGLRETWYSRGADEGGSVNREMFDLGVTVSSKVNRIFVLKEAGDGVDKIRHSIEPQFTWRFVPEVDQDDLPYFDGVDRIGKQHSLSLALVNRFTARDVEGEDVRKFDFFTLRLTQSFDIVEAQRDENLGTSPRRPFSQLRVEWTARTRSVLALSGDVNYDHYENQVKSVNNDIRLMGSGWRVSVGERYTRDSLTFLRGEAWVKPSQRWEARGRVYYDAKNRKMREWVLDAKYTKQCWAVGAFYQFLPNNSRFMVTVTLKGLGSIKL